MLLLKAVGWSPAITLPVLGVLAALGFEELPSNAWAVSLAVALTLPPLVMILHLRLSSRSSAAEKALWVKRLRSWDAFGAVFDYLLTTSDPTSAQPGHGRSCGAPPRPPA